ncbi:MAG: phosphoribosylformylglycinamidine synthase [Bacteroidota bacterium]
MVTFFSNDTGLVFAVQHDKTFDQTTSEKLTWLFGKARKEESASLSGKYVGPRKEMLTPWSTNAVEITQNMGISGIIRIEEFFPYDQAKSYDPMLQSVYDGLNDQLYKLDIAPAEVLEINDISAYNEQESLALSKEEIDYLNGVSEELGRKLTDSEVFGFSQVNSEHCRHKIFNGQFIIDGEEMPTTLFQLIKKTSKANDRNLVSAYKDNVAFVKGPLVQQFAPQNPQAPSAYQTKDFQAVLSLKAETHNFPTTVEPFNGAATGSGGEIRDRMAGGKASVPLAGTAVYMTSYSRLKDTRPWENGLPERKWLYQSPKDILIKASNGASDFGNKFGQPLICGSLLTFEHAENGKKYGFDKVIMQAGGIGFGKHSDAQKENVSAGEKIVVMGGDNYRIGMGGGAVSSVATGEFSNSVELNAIQRSNPEMQKRVANAIRAMAEEDENPIISIHDHGAGGHLNCLSELVEDTGGVIDVHKLPIGDPTLSDKEIIGNESQERMGLVIKDEHLNKLKNVAERERAPIYEVGTTSDDHQFVFENKKTGKNPIDWSLRHMFGSSPVTILKDKDHSSSFAELIYDQGKTEQYLAAVMQLEAVACKDWLTNKVDRCVTGKVAVQQTTGSHQLPLNNVAVMALDFKNNKGIATSIGHAPVVALADATAGSRIAIAEALTNLVWAPIEGGLSNVSLSANWMWPAKQEGENARLYKAVKAVSDFAIDLDVNIPTGKDSLSMVQKYPDNETVYAPGTVIISSVAEVSDVRKVVSPDIKDIVSESHIMYIPFTESEMALGGTSLAQVLNKVGSTCADVSDAEYFKKAFTLTQELIANESILAGHDVSSGGLITALLEMCFPSEEIGLSVSLDSIPEEDHIKILFNENPGIVIQVQEPEVIKNHYHKAEITCYNLGTVNRSGKVAIADGSNSDQLDVGAYRNIWFETSYLLDREQTKPELAEERSHNVGKLPLRYQFPQDFKGTYTSYGINLNVDHDRRIKAAVIREKGSNSEREMAYMMHIAGFEVRDVHMTDLVSGRETLEDINFIVFVGGFSNSDVLGSAKGWAGTFIYNERAKKVLDNFYKRPDTLSLGVCNGCQLMMELGLIYPDMQKHPVMQHNESGKFECTFSTVKIEKSSSVLLEGLEDTELGIWSAHGEGKFALSGDAAQYNIAMKFSNGAYPANPNGSDHNAAGVTSSDGRHLAMMPHLERSMFPWNWPYYPAGKTIHEITPWIQVFINARQWIEKNT